MIRPSACFPNRIAGCTEENVRKLSGTTWAVPLGATVFGKLNDPDEQRYLITWTLYENQPYVEINWGVHGKKPNPLPEAGWLSFPFDLKDPDYRLYRTGGIVDPKRDFVERSNKDFCFLNTSIAMFDNLGNGVTVNCPTSPRNQY